MPTPTKGPRLGGSPAHERLMLANLATALFEHDRITTTEAKAKRLRPLAERLITFAKRGDLHARRRVMRVVGDKDVVHKLFAEIGPRYTERSGGYTRIVKVGPRKGDNAPMAVIELVESMTPQAAVVAEAEAARGSRFARRRAASGRTAELAQEHKRESATAAAVAAGAADDDDADLADAADEAEAGAAESADGADSGASDDADGGADADGGDDAAAAEGGTEDGADGLAAVGFGEDAEADGADGAADADQPDGAEGEKTD